MFMGAALFGVIATSKLENRVQQIQTAEQSNPLWIASQLHFEFLRLEKDIAEFSLGYTSADDLMLRFDIAWSQINVLQEGHMPRVLEDFGISDAVVTELEATFQRLEPAIQSLRTNDLTIEARRDRAEEILRALEGFDLSLREFLLAMSHEKSREMSNFRTDLLSLSRMISYISATILSLLAIFIFFLLLEIRAARDAEDEMRVLAEEASSAARMKMNFMSVVSHELRTPLTSILGGLALLKHRLGTIEDETALKLLDTATRNGDRLLVLVNDILDAQALSEGKVSVTRKPVDLTKVVVSAVENCRAYTDKLGVSFEVNVPAGKLEALTDSARVTQILANLISNAAKFTTSGDVAKVSLRRIDQKARIEVTDHGMGIPAERQHAIFLPFHQVNPGTTGSIKSSGLGLSISKQLIDLLGGEIGFSSVEGMGTTFWIELDLIPEKPLSFREERPVLVP